MKNGHLKNKDLSDILEPKGIFKVTKKGFTMLSTKGSLIIFILY